MTPNARSQVAGYFHLSDHPNITKYPKLNGAILVECKTLKRVVSSSAESEVAGIYHNARMAITIRHILKALNYPQPPTPLKTDNSTATGFVYDKKTLESLGHAVLLVVGSDNTTTIRYLLGKRLKQSRRLLHKTPLDCRSSCQTGKICAR